MVKFPVTSPKCRATSPLQRSNTYVVSNGAADESDIYKVQISAEGYFLVENSQADYNLRKDGIHYVSDGYLM